MSSLEMTAIRPILTFARPKVLLVDDHHANLMALGELLRQDDMELLFAESGTEALELLLVHDVALAIIDVQMPGMDGFELTELMRGVERAKYVPIIFVTAGLRDAERRFHGYEAGAVDFLYKPIETDILKSKVNVFLAIDRQRRELARLLAERTDAESRAHESEARLQSLACRLERTVEERTEELVASQERLRALGLQLNLAEQRERKRLATELHDHLQQLLVYGKMTIGQGKRRLTDVPAAVDVMQKLDEVLSEALRYTRTLVTELSPPVLRDYGLAAGLKWLAEYMKKLEQAVTVTVPDSLGPELPEGQVILLFQSVRELLINSAKHAGTGKATVTLEHQDATLSITVRDEGKGFDLAAAGTPSGEISSKFGLLSIHERMRALGGSCIVQSAPGRGTTATLILPLAKNAENQASSPESLRASVVHTGRGADKRSPRTNGRNMVKVLLVDDHAMVRQGLRSVLDAYDDLHVVAEARDGAEAVQLVDDLHPRVVVMDINMPRMNGVEATTHIKKFWPETTVIGISVNTEDNNGEAMRRAGAATVLPKESAVDQLHDAIVHEVGARPESTPTPL